MNARTIFWLQLPIAFDANIVLSGYNLSPDSNAVFMERTVPSVCQLDLESAC